MSSQVLGISVTDLEVATVVADAGSGEVLARNFVELPGHDPAIAFDAISQLVQSAPVSPSAITIACADSATLRALSEIIDSGTSPSPTPEWFARTTVVGTPVAYAEIASAVFGARGVVLVADLDQTGALFPGQSVALVDTTTRMVVGASEISGAGVRPPVTEPDGAQLLADAVAVIHNPSGVLQGIAVVGPGAALPGVAPSLEYALQLPVQLADEGQYAAAYGAAMVAAATPRGHRVDNRWVLLSAAAAAALLLVIGVITAVVLTGEGSVPNTAVDEQSVTTEFSSTTTTTSKKTSTVRPRISSPALIPEPTTTVAPPPPAPITVTVVPEPTTVTQTPTPPPPPPPPPSSEVTPTTTEPPVTTTTETTTSPPVTGSPGSQARNSEPRE